MTTNLIRKQIYINSHQLSKLRMLSRRRGVSEAEIIRQAIDREAEVSANSVPLDSHAALEKLLHAAEERRASYSTDQHYRFDRDELYEERENQITDHIKEHHDPDSD